MLFDKLDCWRNTILRSHFYCSTGCEEETLNHQSFQSQPIQYKLAEKFIPQLGFHIAGQGLHPQAAGMNTFTYINYNKKKNDRKFRDMDVKQNNIKQRSQALFTEKTCLV